MSEIPKMDSVEESERGRERVGGGGERENFEIRKRKTYISVSSDHTFLREWKREKNEREFVIWFCEIYKRF